MNTCFTCHNELPQSTDNFTTGYGVDKDGNKFCYACCAENDQQYMRDKGKITLYLTTNTEGKQEITNWPGSLRFPTPYVKRSFHNIAKHRYDTWFVFEGYYWHAVQYGDNTEIAHCKRTKDKPSC